MFNPSREQVRQFFFETWERYRSGAPLEGLQTVALDVILAHPEYHALLAAPETHADREWFPEQGETNPFLHMSLHLAIEEQRSIDQPPGVRATLERLEARLGDRHAALHVALDCLGEIVWRAQRAGTLPDQNAYLECLRRAC
jgi:hypothetical protein